MPRRMILTDAERQSFLALPTDDETLIRHWSLDDEDHHLLETRRRDDTRLGLALQLCALRYPGRLIQRGEIIPEASLAFLAEQLGINPEALTNFARGVAVASTKDRYVVTTVADEMRRLRIVIPGITVIERLAG